MQLTQTVTPPQPTRQARLIAWLDEKGLTLAGLIALAGLELSVSRLSRLCTQKSMPVRHHVRLLFAGVPQELLPLAEDQKPGPKPRPKPIPHDVAMAAFRGM